MLSQPGPDAKPSRPRLLIVDDDDGVLAAVRRFLRRYRFEVKTAASGQEGLQELELNGPFQLVIADYRMPGMSGSQFLELVAERYPLTRRMILSAYADSDQLLAAINAGTVHRYLTKPWDSRELLVSIRQLLEEYRKLARSAGSPTDALPLPKEPADAQRTTPLEAQGRQLQESNHRLRLLAAHVEQVREEERRAIARDVHDDLGQTLTAMNLELAAMLRVEPGMDLRPRLQGLKEQVDLAIGTVQRIISDMRPPVLDELGLEAALTELVRRMQVRGGFACVLSCALAEEPLPPVVATCLYRVTQEALTNVLRHAGASKVLVTLRRRSGWCQLQVRDNGHGVREDQIAAADSYGLMGMRERIAQCGGSFSISPRAGGGTIVEAELPECAEEVT